jgi:hypothetical protein
MKALIRKKLGLRYILDPCPLNDTLVKGSHGLPASNPQDGAVLISSAPEAENLAPRHQRDVARIARSLLGL